MKRRWPWWVLVLAVTAALGLGFQESPREVQAVTQAELFQAVKSYLTENRVPEQDMPRVVRKVTPLPNGHYLVEMQMVLGVGWFEVWQDGGRWQVRGAPPPS